MASFRGSAWQNWPRPGSSRPRAIRFYVLRHHRDEIRPFFDTVVTLVARRGLESTRKVRAVRNAARDLGGHSTRLSALFVAAILIPGCFLAYFSIQNVGSQKELAEKRLQEEEQQLAEAFGVAVV